MKIVVVLCTVPDQACAEQLAQIVLEARLAACVSYLPPMTSLYHWQGTIERQTEIQLLLKTDSQRQAALFMTLKEHHPYQVPELLAWPVDTPEAAYEAWLIEALTAPKQ
ncbi:divalent-cation tolerance protein CutA [unidentified bacterial endosymbiont]|uniref:divalent-cation tolerance protein CutA n=1 Tax=unidentified bacterial endosymbiont TaxID=2355 RepID=UPI00209E0DB6|nr:divalent-cation tolerance protein CutA [unidentified bacterial endosymbiont]